VGQIRGEASEQDVLERMYYRPPDRCGQVHEVFLKNSTSRRAGFGRVLTGSL